MLSPLQICSSNIKSALTQALLERQAEVSVIFNEDNTYGAGDHQCLVSIA